MRRLLAANCIDVVLLSDGSVSVSDNGRGMPVDLHPEEGIPGVELILTKLHAGGKFSNKHYQFSGGLHGVGVSVVNALSKAVDVEVRRDGRRYDIGFANGDKVRDLSEVGFLFEERCGYDRAFQTRPTIFRFGEYFCGAFAPFVTSKSRFVFRPNDLFERGKNWRVGKLVL